MATDPKIKPCHRCRTDESVAVYSYDNKAQHVECDKCHYLGPASGSRRYAIKLHNAKMDELLAASKGETG